MKWLSALGAILVAVLGGIAKQMNDWLLTGGKIDWKIIAARAVVSAFVGFLFFEIFSRWNSEWTYIACGVSGWLGADAVTLVIQRVKLKNGE